MVAIAPKNFSKNYQTLANKFYNGSEPNSDAILKKFGSSVLEEVYGSGKACDARTFANIIMNKDSSGKYLEEVGISIKKLEKNPESALTNNILSPDSKKTIYKELNFSKPPKADGVGEKFEMIA